MALTDSQIKALKRAEKRYSKTDGEGLSIDVMPTGKKSWTLKLTKNGKQTRIKLGDYPTLSLKDARELAAKERKTALMGLRDITLGEVIDEWFAIYSKAWTSEKYKYTVLYRIDLVSANLKHRIIHEINRQEIANAITPIIAEGKLETASRSLRILRGIFDYAIVKNYLAVNPCHLVEKIIPERNVKNMASLPLAEMPKLWATLHKMKMNPSTRCALALYNYLAVRPSELAGARWEEFDLEAGVWLIPAHRMKMRKEHMVPLPRQPLEILRALHAERKSEVFVFPKHGDPSAHMAIETPLAVLKKSGFDMVTHGFRALFSTAAYEAQLWDSDVIEYCLAHVQKARGRKAYNRAKYWEPRVRLMQWWADTVSPWIDEK